MARAELIYECAGQMVVKSLAHPVRYYIGAEDGLMHINSGDKLAVILPVHRVVILQLMEDTSEGEKNGNSTDMSGV